MRRGSELGSLELTPECVCDAEFSEVVDAQLDREFRASREGRLLYALARHAGWFAVWLASILIAVDVTAYVVRIDARDAAMLELLR